MKLDEIKIRIEQLIEKGKKTITTQKDDGYYKWVNNELYHDFRSSSLSFFENYFGHDHPFYDEFNMKVGRNLLNSVTTGLGILNAARDEIEGGWISTAKGLVSAEIFSDFLEMASYLLSEGYKDPAAVMIGSVLEEHLKQLCMKNNIPCEIDKSGKMITKKADTLNAELADAKVYNKLDQKSVTAWLDLRNKAAHGQYNEYTKDQVEFMLKAVRDFITRISL